MPKKKKKRNPSQMEKAAPWLVGGGLLAAFLFMGGDGQAQTAGAGEGATPDQIDYGAFEDELDKSFAPDGSGYVIEPSERSPYEGVILDYIPGQTTPMEKPVDPIVTNLWEEGQTEEQAQSRDESALSYKDKSVVTLTEVIEAGNRGDKSVFRTPKPVENYKHIPIGTRNKKRIIIDSIDNMKAICDNLIFPAFLVFKANKPKLQREAKETVIDWLNYNEFWVGDKVLDSITEVFVNFGCKQDTERAWWGDLTYPGIYTPIEKCGKFRDTVKNWTDEKLWAWNRSGVETRFQKNGLGLMLEYTSARYAQLVFVAALDPSKAKDMTGQLISMASSAVGLAVSITAGVIAGTASAVPIVGWILAGIALIVQAIAAIFTVHTSIGATRQLRMSISDQIDDILQTWFHRDGMVKLFPAYYSPNSSQQFPLFVPTHYPMDDITDPYYMVMALVWTNSVKAVPNLPFHYLQIGFDFPVSIDAITKSVLLLAPAPDKQGNKYMGYKEKFLSQGQMKNIIF